MHVCIYNLQYILDRETCELNKWITRKLKVNIRNSLRNNECNECIAQIPNIPGT